MRILTCELDYSKNEYAHLFTLPSTNNKWYYNKSRIGRTYVIFRLSFVRNAYKQNGNGNNVKICDYLLSSTIQNNDIYQLRNLSENDDFIVFAKCNDDYSIDVYAKANYPLINMKNMSLMCDIIGGDISEGCIIPHSYSHKVVIDDTTGYIQPKSYTVLQYANITSSNDFTWNNGGHAQSKVLVDVRSGMCDISAKISGTKRASNTSELVLLGVIEDYKTIYNETLIAFAVMTDKSVVPLQCVIGTSGNVGIYGLVSGIETETVKVDFISLQARYKYK